MKTVDELYELAVEARKNSYTPYSNFKVGAAIVFEDGDVVLGCNIENASYGLTNCAERTAIFKAVSEGKDMKKVVQFAIIADTLRPVSPCGACRQVISEFIDENTDVYLMNLKKDVLIMKVKELIPYYFHKGDMNE